MFQDRISNPIPNALTIYFSEENFFAWKIDRKWQINGFHVRRPSQAWFTSIAAYQLISNMHQRHKLHRSQKSARARGLYEASLSSNGMACQVVVKWERKAIKWEKRNSESTVAGHNTTLAFLLSIKWDRKIVITIIQVSRAEVRAKSLFTI